MTARKHDLVVFGATSFVGQILCRYLLEQFRTEDQLDWTIAGRSRAKLEDLRESLGPRARKLPIIVADAADTAALGKMCTQTHVVASTVGPYALYGEPLVQACTETGTDYCDLTGEVQWIRRMIQRYEGAARKSGARIVHCCGFDSLPSDLGVHFLQKESVARFGEPCTRVKMRLKGASGGFSGGTIASLVNVVKEASKDPSLRRELGNPYSLCPDDYRGPARQPDVRAPQYDRDFDSWAAPFIMAAINTRIVQRSNALSKQAYGAEFQYDEGMLTGRGLRGRAMATAIAAGLPAVMVVGAIGPLRNALERYVLPKPGEGPSIATQEKGFWDARFVGRTSAGQVVRTKVTGDRDPGYGSTAKMLGQAAACLALDLGRDRKHGGFWTPATLLGDRLVERLRAHSGVTFELLEK